MLRLSRVTGIAPTPDDADALGPPACPSVERGWRVAINNLNYALFGEQAAAPVPGRENSSHAPRGGTGVGQLTGMNTTIVVRDKDRAEQAVRESEHRYKRLLASVTDYVFSVTVEEGPDCSAPQKETARPVGFRRIPWIPRPCPAK